MVCIASRRTGERREVPEYIEGDPVNAIAADAQETVPASTVEAPDYNHQDGTPHKLCIAYFEPDVTRARYNDANGICSIGRIWENSTCR